ncbi:DinB family protein [Gilvibacter sp.]|uniref:DinB family protein n=1 Tax=Gilvibacter sp. TaxID=2729997 RepID=UPI0035BE9199
MATIAHFISQIQEIQAGKPWIGSSYERKLAEVDPSLVYVRPTPKLKSIAALISHLTLWREEAVLKIKTGQGSKTDACIENWLPDKELQAQGWNSIWAAYQQSFTDLISSLKGKEDSFLQQTYYDTDFKGEYTYQWLLDGILQHDVYHLGQLGLIIKHLKE